jgi:hypothetical protein
MTDETNANSDADPMPLTEVIEAHQCGELDSGPVDATIGLDPKIEAAFEQAAKEIQTTPDELVEYIIGEWAEKERLGLNEPPRFDRGADE